MAHLVHNSRQGDLPEADQLKHCGEGMLYEGCPGRTARIGILLLLPAMGCMIGGDDIDSVFQQACEKSVLIRFGLDGRVPFDPGSKPAVIPIIKPEMVYTDFGCDLFLSQGNGRFEKGELPAGRQVKDMKPCAVLFCQVNGSLRGDKASLFAADQRVGFNRNGFAVSFTKCRQVLPDDRFVFAVNGYDEL